MTDNLDIEHSYGKFLRCLPEKAHVLDAGCGVGRDTKYFLSKGRSVSAFDASSKMMELSVKKTSVKVMHATLQELEFEEMFDGVWGQDSLLHIPYEMTRQIYQKIHHALKPKGVFYASYKYGNSYMETPERVFYNMNEDKTTTYFSELFDIVELWKEKDDRSKLATRPDGMWINFIVRKI